MRRIIIFNTVEAEFPGLKIDTMPNRRSRGRMISVITYYRQPKSSSTEALVNTVNTAGVLGKDIALQFKRVFPHNFEVYKDACLNGNLGQAKYLQRLSTGTSQRIELSKPLSFHINLIGSDLNFIVLSSLKNPAL